MTLLIKDSYVSRLLSMKECIEAMEVAFREYGQGVAVNRPRVRYSSRTPHPGAEYFANIIVGAVPGYGAAAVRIDSLLWREQIVAGMRRMGTPQPGKRNWGLILLYSLEDGELLAIMHDFTISGIRVGATTALGAKYLAREDASTLGLLGSGKLARTNLEGMALVRPLRRVKVFSPNPEHRRGFAQEMSARMGIEVRAVDEAREAVRGVDIVCCSTNSNEPVFDGRWLEPGQTVISIVNTDVVRFRTEVDEATFLRSHSIVVNDKESVFANRQRELLDPIEGGLFTWDKVHELGEVVTGKVKGRSKPEEITYFKNSTGMGIQFAAAGAMVYKRAVEKGVGRKLPSEWFGTDLSGWYEKGFYPSP